MKKLTLAFKAISILQSLQKHPKGMTTSRLLKINKALTSYSSTRSTLKQLHKENFVRIEKRGNANWYYLSIDENELNQIIVTSYLNNPLSKIEKNLIDTIDFSKTDEILDVIKKNRNKPQ